MEKKSGRAAIAVAALAITSAAGSAQAAEVVNLPLSAVLGNNQSFSGSFDISSFLTDALGNQYKVIDATVQLAGASAFGQTYAAVTGHYQYISYYVQQAYYYSYSCGWWSTCTGTSYNTVPVYATGAYYTAMDGVQDTLALNTGVGSGLGQDGPQAQGYYGPLLASALLGGADLASANSSGLVTYTATAYTNSNIQLYSAELDFTREMLPSVPEPGSWAMMLVGFAMIGAALRKRPSGAKTLA